MDFGSGPSKKDKQPNEPTESAEQVQEYVDTHIAVTERIPRHSMKVKCGRDIAVGTQLLGRHAAPQSVWLDEAYCTQHAS